MSKLKWTIPVLLFAFFCSGLMAWNARLHWDPNPATEQVTTYHVYRTVTQGSGYTEIGTTAARDSQGNVIPNPEFLDSGLIGGPYFYVVTAENTGGESPFSNESRADQPVPTAPLGLVVDVEF